ncbi:MAG: lytic murein transglycosylase [Proteobacteria bacterium]|nr:lytic murein transglycosylase [Pseudomonadota bacterium]
MSALRSVRRLRVAIAVTAMAVAATVAAHAADAAFADWLLSQWPQAQKLGVSRATFEAATRGLEPDLSLPDLDIPGRAARAPAQQAEFVRTPADYVREVTIARLAAHAKKLHAAHRSTLERIEERFGVPGHVVLAIWGRETDFGRHKNTHSAVRVLATQAFYGRRKAQFAEEFLLALKMIEEGHVSLAAMKSSWAGAMGLTQFLPSDFYRYAVDFDGDARRDIFSSVPDALASAANQLAGKGWQRGRRWAYEVRAPKTFDCTIAQPTFTLPVGEWIKRGFAPAGSRRLSAAELADSASLLLPEGAHGPAFLAPKNYFVIKEYNFSDLYVLFVGHLSDRILDGARFEAPWSKDRQLRTAQVEAMQQRLTAIGLYGDKIDGKAGMLTRAALGAYQKQNGLKVDCWPTPEVLRHMQARRGSQ